MAFQNQDLQPLDLDLRSASCHTDCKLTTDKLDPGSHFFEMFYSCCTTLYIPLFCLFYEMEKVHVPLQILGANPCKNASLLSWFWKNALIAVSDKTSF